MRIFREEIFGPVLAVTTFKSEQALTIANDALWLGGGGLDPDRKPCVSVWAWHSGRAGVDQLLSRLPGTCGVWWVQGIGHWP